MALSETEKSPEYLRYQELISKCQPITLEASATREEHATRDNANKLKELTNEGHRKVANVILAASVRNKRSVRDIECTKRDGSNRLDDERLRFDAVNSELAKCWARAFELSVPQELHGELKTIKDMSEAILQEKDDLVDYLEKALGSAEHLNELQHQSQCEDLAELQNRMEQHYISLQNAYRAQLKSIDNAMLGDRYELIMKENELLDQILSQSSQLEDACLKRFTETAEEMEDKMNATDQSYYENRQRIYFKLKDDIELLEEQLQSLRASCLLNGEKLDYGCQVLRHRQEEGASYLAQQKRKINKLLDQNRLSKSTLDQKISKSREEEAALKEEVKTVRQNIELLDAKTANIIQSEHEKIQAVWELENSTLRRLKLKLLELEKQICEEILQRPQPSNERFQSQNSNVSQTQNSKSPMPSSQYRSQKHWLLQTIAEELSFFLEPEIKTLIESMTCDTDRELVKMDTLFQKLQISNATELDELIQHLQNGQTKTDNVLDLLTEYFENKGPWIRNENVESKPIWDRSEQDIVTQFKQYESVLTPETLRLWDLVRTILAKYYSILKGRHDEAHKIYQRKSGHI